MSVESLYEVQFRIGPCTATSASALAVAVMGLPEFRDVGGGAVALEGLFCACGAPLIDCVCGDMRCPACDPVGCPNLPHEREGI